MTTRYEPNWRSLREHRTPRWFIDAKFGIYTHWGIYSVPAFGPNATWYPYRMYREGEPHHAHHLKTYGHPSEFGYKDFIPQFTGAKFDADQWADLFKRAGAQFAGPVAEHHDGFALWDSAHTEWNAARMGPKRDVVGELAQAVRRQDMRFMVAMHHAENWWFFPHWRTDFDTSDPRFAGLYGPPHNLDFPLRDAEWDEQDKPSKAFLDTWKAKLVEVVEKYEPDYIWFDFGLKAVHEQYKQDFLAYYYNKEAEWGRGVVVTYKWDNLPPGVGVLDIELGKMPDQAYHEWITDTTVDDGSGWGYLRETEYKSATELVQYLVDNVSKNGLMLLNVGPKPDGTIPDEAVVGAGGHRRVATRERRGDLRVHALVDLRRRPHPDAGLRRVQRHQGKAGLPGQRYPVHGEGKRPLRDLPGLARTDLHDRVAEDAVPGRDSLSGTAGR